MLTIAIICIIKLTYNIFKIKWVDKVSKQKKMEIQCFSRIWGMFHGKKKKG